MFCLWVLRFAFAQLVVCNCVMCGMDFGVCMKRITCYKRKHIRCCEIEHQTLLAKPLIYQF